MPCARLLASAVLAVTVLTITAALPFGCASSTKGEERTAKAASSLTDLRDQLARTRDQIATTLASLNTLATQSAGDLKSPYKKYSDNVSKTESEAKKTSALAKDMKSRTEDYVNKWAESTAELSPELKAKADARRTTVRERIGAVTTAATATKDAFDPFMKDLQDIQKYLSNDLTFGGIGSLGDTIQKTNAEGATLQDRVNALISELDKVAASLSSHV